MRNVLVTPSGPALVDFDDLTLAPFGYDLAKLVVSTAMTFGTCRGSHAAVDLKIVMNRGDGSAPLARTRPERAATSSTARKATVGRRRESRGGWRSVPSAGCPAVGGR